MTETDPLTAAAPGCDHEPGWQCVACVPEGGFRFEPMTAAASGSTPEPQQVREIAREHILDDARRGEVGAIALGRFGPDAMTKHEYGAWCSAIREAIRTATISVSWPGEQAQQVRDSAEAAGRLRNDLNASYAMLSLPEPIRADLRAVLDKRERLAARVAKLEAERELWFNGAARRLRHAYRSGWDERGEAVAAVVGAFAGHSMAEQRAKSYADEWWGVDRIAELDQSDVADSNGSGTCACGCPVPDTGGMCACPEPCPCSPCGYCDARGDGNGSEATE